MRPVIVVAALTLAGMARPTQPLTAQDEMADVRIQTVAVAEGLYMLVGRGGNIGLSVGADGAFLVDDQFAPLTARIQAAVSVVSEQPVKFVLNTHWHGDHTGGNENLGGAGAMIVAHQNVRRRLNPSEFRDVVGNTQQAPPAALPIVTFTDAVTFYWNGDTIQVFHVPTAHTDGDAIVVFNRANVIHMGDVFFNGRYPFIDIQSGGAVHGVIAAAEQILWIADSQTKIIPGHGDVAGVTELRAYRDMLRSVRDRIQLMINDGLSEDEVVAARPTRDLDATWGAEPERFVRAVYQSLHTPG